MLGKVNRTSVLLVRDTVGVLVLSLSGQTANLCEHALGVVAQITSLRIAHNLRAKAKEKEKVLHLLLLRL